MRIFANSTWYVFVAVIFVAAAAFLLYKTFNSSTIEWVTATVEKGTVSEVVSVSGFTEAKLTAALAFPSSGIVTDVLVEEGTKVETGDILATLAATELVAERQQVVNSLAAAKATYDKTVSGPRQETLAVAKTTLTNAEENLVRVTTEENRKVNNARTALLSTGLTAAAKEADEASTAPTISGTYSCSDEGSYNLEVYSSGEKSGYSYTFSGLESSKGAVSFDQPAPLGNCGLYLLFKSGDFYSSSQWLIEIPNTRSSAYSTLNNSYQLATTQAENAIAAAKNALALARSENNLSTAGARLEDITVSKAAVLEAEARIAAIDAKIADRSIVAPFSGTVTEVSITEGESASVSPVITILAENTFTLKARIPEIDITKVKSDQTVQAVFDAQSDEKVAGKIAFISPVATQIDGVAYFETTIELETIPEWLRAGLNADVDITTEKREQVLRLSKRFILTLPDKTTAVLLAQGNEFATTSVEVLFTGNDSYVEIAGLTAGAIVVAP